jgi:hypothetical protein
LVSDAGNNVGRGLIANQTIEEGELLFKIPLKYVIHSDAVRHHPVLGKVAHLIPGEVHRDPLYIPPCPRFYQNQPHPRRSRAAGHDS